MSFLNVHNKFASLSTESSWKKFRIWRYYTQNFPWLAGFCGIFPHLLDHLYTPCKSQINAFSQVHNVKNLNNSLTLKGKTIVGKNSWITIFLLCIIFKYTPEQVLKKSPIVFVFKKTCNCLSTSLLHYCPLTFVTVTSDELTRTQQLWIKYPLLTKTTTKSPTHSTLTNTHLLMKQT